MKRGILNTQALILFSVFLLCQGAQANEAPKMPYVFEANCLLCHRVPEQSGPSSIFDMRSKDGNPLHRQYIRSNVRFGLNAMPAFRVSEVSEQGLEDIVRYLEEVAAHRRDHHEYRPAPVQEGKGEE